LGVNLLLSLPIVGGGIAPNGWIDGQVMAISASYLPSLAVERMGAMAAEQPGVMKRQEHWHLVAQPWKRCQVKVSSMQVVAMHNMGSLCRQV
jgi:hypothetical protein